ncbi:MFS transporter [Actinomadura sp. HBU206391]|uniref:MFS transporter n=1 Tax=Actinomadura sp. HBU206391 TaxID=2731692 RepID=UPI00164F5FB2|nr:MFS transporter [Actinomadura sp. HBU206391]MBC6461611.1 MFS transporter [Actinomadura sp. HBU206391]
MSSPSTAFPPYAADSGTRRGRWLGTVIMSLGVSLIVVDATIVNVLIPGIVAELRLDTTDAEWITSVYSLVFAALLIPFGRAGDLFGRRRMFILGTVIFMLASLFIASAGSATALIGARALQGLGASMIMPATLSTVNSMFTGRDRAVAFGIWGSLISGMAALGPLLGGGLANSFGWRWAFAVNLPIGLLLVIGALRFVPETRVASAVRGVDWTGGVLAALGLGALACGLIEGQSYGWWLSTRPFAMGPLDWPPGGLSPIPVVLALGVVLISALVVVERIRARAGRPVMLDLELFRISGFRWGNAVSALISSGELGLLFVLPLFLLNVHDDSPLQISVAIVPLAVGALLAGPFAGRLSHRYGPPRVVRIGVALEVAAVLAIAVTLDAGTTGLRLAPWMLAYGIGLGLTSAQLTNVSLADVPTAQSGQASGTQSTARQIGSALGIAIIGTVFATSLSHTMLDRLQDTPVPQEQRAALAQQLRSSAGTSARDLRHRPGASAPENAPAARAAAESLAVATRRGALATAAILGLGLLMTLRLGRSGVSTEKRHPQESSP